MFVGGTLQTGGGEVSYTNDYGSYTFAEPGLSTADTKVFVGINDYYLFAQSGVISFDTPLLNDVTYSAFGIGFIYSSDKYKKVVGPLTIKPEIDLEIGVESTDADSQRKKNAKEAMK